MPPTALPVPPGPVVESSQAQGPDSADDNTGPTEAATTQRTAQLVLASSMVDPTSDHEARNSFEHHDSAANTATSDEEDNFDLEGKIPASIRGAEARASTWVLSQAQPLHSRYSDFLEALCRETSTASACDHTTIGLPDVANTARGLQLDQDYSDNIELDLFAHALVIHVWLVVCMRLQHGIFSNEEDSLSTYCGAYFVSAYWIGRESCKASASSYKFAVEYWEKRLWVQGNRRHWLNTPWAASIPLESDLDSPHRNETADRYLAAMGKIGRGNLVPVIIAEEAKTEATQLRKSVDEDRMGARSDILMLLASMDDALLRALIDGQLPRKAEIPDGAVYNALQRCNRQAQSQPGTYLNAICDRMGHSPTPAQWRVVCNRMIDYTALDHDHDEFARELDQLLHPKPAWYDGLASRGLRRYTDWREVIDKNKFSYSSHRRNWVRYFVDQLQTRMEDEMEHAPLRVPVVEIGYSTEPRRRLQEHLQHESSNYLMNLAEALFEYDFPGSFRLQQNVVYVCFRPVQAWLSEVIITQLAQGYVEGGGGFSHETAGRSNGSGYKSVTDEEWDRYENEAGDYVDAYLEEFGATTEQAIELERIRMRRQQDRFAVEKRYLESVIGLVESFTELVQARSRLRQ